MDFSVSNKRSGVFVNSAIISSMLLCSAIKKWHYWEVCEREKNKLD